MDDPWATRRVVAMFTIPVTLGDNGWPNRFRGTILGPPLLYLWVAHGL